MSGSFVTTASLVLVAFAHAALAATAEPVPQVVEFNRDIRPILSDKCYTCHGPDQRNRKTKLRFDNEAGAKADLGGRFAIVGGDLSKSEMYRRISAENKALRMPPVYSGTTLTDREIALIRRWIEQGARWEKHWSFIPPKRPALPDVSKRDWPSNAIDYFVLARLEHEGLAPSPEADRATIIRRVSLDLTGLPPTPAEVDAFLADQSPGAYEKVVDRLLAAPRYGERMAERWLDAARYADTNGYQTDAERYMWRWRDWVIDAFNRNLPFDRFTVEQIAGDLLPNATLDQRIATGFNRNHRGNGEGGIIPEEYAVEYVVDRVDTTATVFLGVTLGCARCHDHKYDPFKQKEFYQVFAYFNNVPEKGKAQKYGNSPPLITAPAPQQQAHLQELAQRLATEQHKFAALGPEISAAQQAWEKTLRPDKPLWWWSGRNLVAQYALHDVTFDGRRGFNGGQVAKFGFFDKFTLAAWVKATAGTGAIVTRGEDVSEGKGYGLYLKDGKLQVNLVARWLDDALRVETESSLPLNEWHHVAMTYDGSRYAQGVRIYIDGVPQKLKVNLDELNQSFDDVKSPLRVGAGGGPENRFHGSIHDVRIYNAALSAGEAAMLATRGPVSAIAALPPEKRNQAQADLVRVCFLDQYAPEHIRQAWNHLIEAHNQMQRFVDSLPTVMVMQEMPAPRETHVLLRGAYDRPGDKVSPGLPSILPPLPQGAPNNRLGFARWLVDPANPLTARVTVNRFWQLYFGTGIVKTVEDFGSQGEWPTNPELLDWLATEFIRTGWDVKALQKTIVTSATYRQSSRVTPQLLQKDPENRLLARGPRFRLSAEMVRDQALAISGLLVEKIGGPSVKPYQPAGLWKELSGAEDYQQDHGANLYRRSLYTFWKRSVPPPSMMNFDSAGREACTVRETRTNTPLQALDLMNDVTYLEAARVLAQRMMQEGGTTPEDRITFAFRLATAHQPGPKQAAVLLNAYRYYRDDFQTGRTKAVKFVSVGEAPRNESLDLSDLAAYTAVASMILNLDETINKE